MAGKSDYAEANFLKLLFNATAWSLIADNTATTPLTQLFVSLHTADPGDAGSQTTSEISYTGYARVGVARTTGGWTVSGTSPTSVSPVADITFGAMTAGAGGTVTFAGVGTLVSTAGNLLYSGALTPNLTVANGVTPIVKATSTITED